MGTILSVPAISMMRLSSTKRSIHSLDSPAQADRKQWAPSDIPEIGRDR
jgi:hypothetical protein